MDFWYSDTQYIKYGYYKLSTISIIYLVYGFFILFSSFNSLSKDFLYIHGYFIELNS